MLLTVFFFLFSFLLTPFLSFSSPIFPPFVPPFFPLPGHVLLYRLLVAQGRVWALLQVNPSSDNDRFGRDGLEEEHIHSDVDPREHRNDEAWDLHLIHQTHDDAASCGQCLLTSRPQPEPEHERHENIPSSDIPEEQVHQLHFHQHVLPSSPSVPQPSAEVFRGTDLVDWLIRRGLCSGRPEARLYGLRLQLGGVLLHLTGQHSFRDETALFYCFT